MQLVLREGEGEGVVCQGQRAPAAPAGGCQEVKSDALITLSLAIQCIDQLKNLKHHRKY